MSVFRRRLAVAVLCSAAFGGAFVGCGYDWDYVDADGGSSDASINGDMDVVGPGNPLDAAMTGDVGTGGTCSPTVLCAQGGTCVYADHMCGHGDDKTGTCVGASSGPQCAPVANSYEYCFCPSSASGAAAGQLENSPCVTDQDFDAIEGGCVAAGTTDDLFQCGYEYCKKGTSFCVVYSEDGGMQCENFPLDCDAADPCGCAKAVVPCVGGNCPPGSDIGTVGSGGSLQLRLTCP